MELVKDIHNVYRLDNDCYIYIDTKAEQDGYEVYLFNEDKELIDGGELLVEEDSPVTSEREALNRCISLVSNIYMDYDDSELYISNVYLPDLAEHGFTGF